ncbi:MAG: polysaccharide deacetylase family protein [Planctomycetes bacterium]|nr:polysaccharide deacetylase family protein [Planctomycetota bacterium]
MKTCASKRTKSAGVDDIFLTFDDGPNEPYTSQILDVLKEHEARATFFVCGKGVERFPQITRRILHEGHSLGNHAYSHSMLLTITGFMRKEIEKTSELILKTTGAKTRLFRPPWGVATPWLKIYLKANKYQTVLWDINSYDWTEIPASSIEGIVLKKARPGAVILLHDGKNTKHHHDRSQTVQALPAIIKALRQKGFCLKGICSAENH